jgi:hypothetical protein
MIDLLADGRVAGMVVAQRPPWGQREEVPMTIRRRLSLIGLALALIACGDDGPVLPGNFVREGPLAAPPLEPLCPALDAAPPTDRLWVVFGGVDCGYCKDWLATLEAERAVLEAHDIAVVYYVGGTSDCGRARTSARHVDFPVGLGTRQQSGDWSISPTPATVFVRDGQVIGRMLGASSPAGVGQLASAFY